MAGARTIASVSDLERLYRERYARFLRVAVAVLGDVEEARDAVHEAFVRALRGIDGFRGEGSLEAWVWRTLLNVCLRERGRPRATGEHADEPAAPDSSGDWPEVRAAIAELPERQRAALFLRHYADQNYDQIAEVLGVARGTVAASLHAAHAKLRAALEEVPR
jgi:RNA polymerase sigma-70 factor, ECF subfamily